MKIGVVADSHDNLPAIRKAVETLNRENVEVIVHAGDFVAPFALREFLKAKTQLIGVFGNNDGERKGLAKLCENIQPGPRLLELGDRKIALAHEEEALTPALLEKASVAVFGHTHKVAVEKGAVLRLNPGECGGWLTGRCTVAILDTESLDVRIVDL
jgi:putative phosphoesterase